MEWANSKEAQEKRLQETPLGHSFVKWEPPSQGWFKCNSDGACPKDGRSCGLGWIVRNNKGDVLWLGAKASPKLRTVMETEAESLRWAVKALVQLGFTNMIFASDSKCLIDALT